MPFVHKIFDLDDTIIKTQVKYENVKKDTALFIQENLHLSLSLQEILDLFTSIDIRNIKDYGFKKERFPISWKQVYSALANQKGEIPIHADEVYERAFEIHRQSFDLYPEAIKTLKKIRKQGIKTSLLTLGEKEIQRSKIEKLSLEIYFDEIYIVERDKFNILNKMSHKEKTSMVGNSLKSDIQPALKAGLCAFHINHDSWVHDYAEIDKTHPRFHQLEKIGDIVPYLENLKVHQ